MLVLARGKEEEVVFSETNGTLIGSIKVVKLGPEAVRLGFTFPTHIRIDRKEVFEEREGEKQCRSM